MNDVSRCRCTNWLVDVSGVGCAACDSQGWYYAFDFAMLPFFGDSTHRANLLSCVRRRRWVRSRVPATWAAHFTSVQLAKHFAPATVCIATVPKSQPVPHPETSADPPDSLTKGDVATTSGRRAATVVPVARSLTASKATSSPPLRPVAAAAEAQPLPEGSGLTAHALAAMSSAVQVPVGGTRGHQRTRSEAAELPRTAGPAAGSSPQLRRRSKSVPGGMLGDRTTGSALDACARGIRSQSSYSVDEPAASPSASAAYPSPRNLNLRDVASCSASPMPHAVGRSSGGPSGLLDGTCATAAAERPSAGMPGPAARQYGQEPQGKAAGAACSAAGAVASVLALQGKHGPPPGFRGSPAAASEGLTALAQVTPGLLTPGPSCCRADSLPDQQECPRIDGQGSSDLMRLMSERFYGTHRQRRDATLSQPDATARLASS
jgi:hypothetical protein